MFFLGKMNLKRVVYKNIRQLVAAFPAVGILGARQVGKTTLAKQLAEEKDVKSIYLDLERPQDLSRLSDPELYLSEHKDKLVIIDEVQRLPSLFPVLRYLIDDHRVAGRFLLLGSASPSLIRESSESLAGRIVYRELDPFCYSELAGHVTQREHWLRGGFPDAVALEDPLLRSVWHESYLRAYAERDLPQLGLDADPVLLLRMFQMIASRQGGLLNYNDFARSLGISAPSVKKYLHVLENAYLVRLLKPYHANTSKRLTKSPKAYIRDTGLLHSLLGISDIERLMGNMAVGNSWESYVIQEVAANLPHGFKMYFYRTQAGAECDVLLCKADEPVHAIEVKLSTSPKSTKGFTESIRDVRTSRNYVVIPGDSEPWPLGADKQVIGLAGLIDNLG